MRLYVLTLFSLAVLPVTALAATSFKRFVNDYLIATIDHILTPLIFSIAFIAFLWGVVQYFFIGAADPWKQETGRSFILWGLLGMIVMFSVWGLVNMILTTFAL